MIIKEEQEKYKHIKNDLIEYRKSLDNAKEAISKFADNETALTMTTIYDRMIYLYEKNKHRPYFAKIVFQKDGEKEKTFAYIGRIGFANLNQDDIIIDWRAPISELYYNSKPGKAEYFVDGEKICGTLDTKRQISFENGEIVQVYDLDGSISSDEFLQPYLSDESNQRLKNIVATIQEEQDKIIRFPLNKNIIVQGVAGSGKTTVALHRLSYLIYNNSKTIKPKNYYIISPSTVFKSYITGLLEDLDADEVVSGSIEYLLNNFVKTYKILKKHQQFEKLNKNKKNTQYLLFKGSLNFAKIIDKYINYLEEKTFKTDFCLDGVKLINSDVMFEKYLACRKQSLEENTKILADYINSFVKNNTQIEANLKAALMADQIGFAKKMNIERTLEKNITPKVVKFYKKLNLADCYKDFISNLNKFYDGEFLNDIQTETLENLNKKIISYDDIGPMLYIATKLFACQDYANIKMVTIDEAQDLSPLAYLAFSKIFKNSYFSIYGDLAQGLYGYQSINSWGEVLGIINNSNYLELNKSYRTTIEITQNANKVLRALNLSEASNVIRHGDAVEVNKSNNIKSDILNQIKNNSKYNIAIICSDDAELEQAKKQLSDVATVLDENTPAFENHKVNLLTVETAKGLEFECVILYNANKYSPSIVDQKKYYVAQTRALHKLIINAL